MTERPSTYGERTFLRHLLIALALVALALLVWRLIDLLLLLFGSVLVAIILRTMADSISRWIRISEAWSLLIAVLALFVVAAGASWLFGAEVAAQTRGLTETVPDAWGAFERRISDSVLGDSLQRWLEEASPEGSSVLSGLGTAALLFGSAFVSALVVVVGGIYLAAQPGLYRTGLLELVPRRQRALIAETLDDTGRALRLWLLGQLVAMSLVGLLIGVGLALIGVPSAFALGLLAGIAEFVPLIGAVVAAIPALLLALAEGNDVALLTLALYVVVQQIEGNVITPVVQQRIATLPPALTLFAILAAGSLFGTLGVLLAAPLTVFFYVVVKRLYVREALDTPTSIPGEQEAKETQRPDG
jgi:predicted PurR-regulated permease PerM